MGPSDPPGLAGGSSALPPMRRIISFITNRPVIDKILRHIGFTRTAAPPARRIYQSPLG